MYGEGLMLYIVVNRPSKPEGESACTFCCTPIGKSYTRDLENRLVYHSHFCREMHITQSMVCIEDNFRFKEGQ